VLRLRFLTAAVGLPLVILAIVLGPLPYCVFLGCVAAMCAYELGRLAPDIRGWNLVSSVAVLFAVLLACWRLLPFSPVLLSLAATVLVVGSLVALLDARGGQRTFGQWSWCMAGALYVGWLFGHWGGVYGLPEGVALVFFGMFTTFFYDTFAYFTGRAFGRHKLAPRVSAGKSWEGACGGVVMAVVGALLVREAALGLTGSFPFSASLSVVAAVVLAVAAQLGDLVESALKRSAGVKDAGGVLPGHGGMLDRFDSLMLSGPMLYYFALWVAA
jgi:phosphatidate cytidylyltransferase